MDQGDRGGALTAHPGGKTQSSTVTVSTAVPDANDDPIGHLVTAFELHVFGIGIAWHGALPELRVIDHLTNLLTAVDRRMILKLLLMSRLSLGDAAAPLAIGLADGDPGDHRQ